MTAAPYPGTAIPELTEDQIKSMFFNLDEQLNTVTLQALTHGEGNQFHPPVVVHQSSCFSLKEYTPA